MDQGSPRPKHLLVFVNPYGGKKKAPKVFEKVRPLFDLANITLDVIGEPVQWLFSVLSNLAKTASKYTEMACILTGTHCDLHSA